MHLRIPGTFPAATSTSPLHDEAPGSLLCIHATGAWSYAGGDEDDDAWPIVAAFEV